MKFSDLEIKVLKAYAGANMNASLAAKNVYRSRQGIDYYLNKVWDRTGINPYTFYGLRDLLNMVRVQNGEITDLEADLIAAKLERDDAKEKLRKIQKWCKEKGGHC